MKWKLTCFRILLFTSFVLKTLSAFNLSSNCCNSDSDFTGKPNCANWSRSMISKGNAATDLWTGLPASKFAILTNNLIKWSSIASTFLYINFMSSNTSQMYLSCGWLKDNGSEDATLSGDFAHAFDESFKVIVSSFSVAFLAETWKIISLVCWLADIFRLRFWKKSL